MRRSEERAAWTAHVEGKPPAKSSKYGNVREGKFASRYEAEIASRLQVLADAGRIRNLEFQVPIRLVEGRGNVRGIVYVADFVYDDLDGAKHYLDAKGFKTAVYRIKKKLALLLHGIEIEEV